MPTAESSQRSLALFFVLLSKVLGIGGLVLGAYHRAGGATLLALDGLFIVLGIALCIRIGREQAKAEEEDKQILARLVREGTLKQYLRDVEVEARRAAAPSLGAAEVEAAAE